MKEFLMRLESFASAVLAANLLSFSASAEAVLPHLQPAAPVFERLTAENRAPTCNGFATYGATIEQTVASAVVDPLLAIVEDMARMFRPFFSDPDPKKKPHITSASVRERPVQSPSRVVKAAARERLCG